MVLDVVGPSDAMVTVCGDVVVAMVILAGDIGVSTFIVDVNISDDGNSLSGIFRSMVDCLLDVFSLVTGIIVIGSFPSGSKVNDFKTLSRLGTI